MEPINEPQERPPDRSGERGAAAGAPVAEAHKGWRRIRLRSQRATRKDQPADDPDGESKGKEKSALQRFAEQFAAIRSITASVLFFLLLIGLAPKIYRHFTTDVIAMETIIVPKQLADAGYTPTVVMQRIREAVDRLRERAAATRKPAHSVPLQPKSAQADIAIPGANVSVRQALSFVSPKPTVSGEVIYDSDQDRYTLMLRFSEPSWKIHETPSRPLEKLDELWDIGAQQIMWATEPYVLGIALREAGLAERAADAFRHCAEVAPTTDDLECQLSRALAAGEANDVAAADEAIRAVKADDADSARAHLTAAIQHNRVGEFADAVDSAQAAIAAAGDDDLTRSQAFDNWGFALFGQEDHDGAIAKYKKAIEFDPENASAYYNWSFALDGSGDAVGARAKYEKAAALDPKKASLILSYPSWEDSQWSQTARPR